MQDLFFDEKNFISVNRASQETGYTQDYLGQLCRSKKIPARMVGRTWYVDYEAIIAHQKSSTSRASSKKINKPILSGAFVTPSVASKKRFLHSQRSYKNKLAQSTEKGKKVITQSDDSEATKFTIFDGKNFISVNRASQETGYTQDYLGQLCRSKKIPARMVGRTWYVDYEAVLKHKQNPTSRKKRTFQSFLTKPVDLLTASSKSLTSSQEAYVSPYTFERDLAPTLPTLRRVEALSASYLPVKKSLRLTYIAVVALVLVTSISWMNMTSPRIAELMNHNIQRISAISAHSGEALYSDLTEGMSRIASGGVGSLASSAGSTAVVPEPSGLVAFPESAANHDKSVATVKSTFSDEADIQFDKNGDSGVITPLFEKGNPAQGYAFVMVPVKNAHKE